MKRRVIIRPRAEADLQEGQHYYAKQRAALGRDFVGRVNEAISYLEEYAERRPFYYGEFRRILVRRFPYKIFYRVEGDRVIVFRALHVKQDHSQKLG